MVNDSNGRLITVKQGSKAQKGEPTLEVAEFGFSTDIGQEELWIGGKNGNVKILTDSNGIHYDDLVGKPFIPTKTSELTNDSKFANETFVITKINEAQFNGGNIDLSDYATKADLNSKADKEHSHSYSELTDKPTIITSYKQLTDKPTIPSKTSDLSNDSGFITIDNLNGYATESFVTTKIAEAQLNSDGNVDLSGYATKDELNNYTLKTELNNYVLKTELKGYATKDELNNKADLNHAHNVSEISGAVKSVNDVLPNENGNIELQIATTWVEIEGKPTEFTPTSHTHSIGEVNGLETALSNKADVSVITDLQNTINTKADDEHLHSYTELTDKPTIPSKTSELTNDSGYATETFVITKIAEAQLNGGGNGTVDLSCYVTKDELNAYALKSDLDNIQCDFVINTEQEEQVLLSLLDDGGVTIAGYAVDADGNLLSDSLGNKMLIKL